jgi:hypothetical protein
LDTGYSQAASKWSNFFAVILVWSLAAVSQAQELGKWRLRVSDLKHELKVDATIQFAAEVATESCMGGDWKRIVVVAKTTQNEKFFPLAEPLAYQFERGELVLGRTKVCDGYLFLSGKSNHSRIQGNYNAVSIGTAEKLGSFSLERIR